jgi:hypothetical protein
LNGKGTKTTGENETSQVKAIREKLLDQRPEKNQRYIGVPQKAEV